MIDQGQANNNYHLLKRVFCALCTQTSRERHIRYAHEQMQDFIEANRQRTALQSLYKAVVSGKILAMVCEKVTLRVNRRAAMDHLQRMRQIARPRYLKNKACQFLHKKRQLVTLRLSLARWHHSVLFLK